MSSTVTVWMGGPIHCIEITRMLRVVFFYREKYENMLIVKTDAKSKFIGGATGKKLQIER
jgi:hypothetical protein